MDNLNDSLLRNCTAMVLSAEFDHSSDKLDLYNSTVLLTILGNMLKASDLTMSKRTIAKDRLHDCVYPIPEPSHNISMWHKLIWSTVFIGMLIVAIIGNAIVIWIVTAHRRMRTVTNCYMVSLSISDLLMASLNCLPNFIYMLNSDWTFGVVLCMASNFIAYWTVASSVFTLVAITLNRYMAIVYPLQHRRSKTRTQTILVFIWFISVFLATPCILFSDLKTKRYTNGDQRRACYMLWPDGRYPNSKTEYIYNILFLCVTYIVPLAVMAVCYTIMGKELWGSKTIGQMTQRHMESIKSKRKVVKMFAIVVTIFLICWFPYHSYFVYAYHNKDIVIKPYVQDLFLSFYWLAMSNSMVNPIIYYWMNPRFRTYFKLIICYCGGLRKSDTASADLNMIQMNSESHYYLTRTKSGPVSLGVQHSHHPPETQALYLTRSYSEIVRHPEKTRDNQREMKAIKRLQRLQNTRKLSTQTFI